MSKEIQQFNEGDDYFALEYTPEGVLTVSMSCWDEISEEIDNPLVFTTLREALNYIKVNMESIETIIFYDFTAPNSVELKI